MSAAKKALDELDRLQASTDLNDDLPAINLALLLASPLAAVARAAMARLWLYADRTCVLCESSTRPETRPGSHTKECPFGDLDAALDALEAAAREVTP